MALHYIILLLLFGLTTIQSESILPNGCPADFHVHRLLPHETDCGLFYQCSNGQRVLTHCAPGTLFSEELQVCVWPYQATCNQIAEPKPPSVPDEESTEPSETEQNTSPDHLPNGCPKDFSIHLLLPHESDCDKFYQCSNGIKYLMQCGAGTLFDYNLQVCNWPDAVECHSTTTEPTVEPITESTTSKLTTEESDEETTVKPTTVEEITEQTTVDVAEHTTDSVASTTEESTTGHITTTTTSTTTSSSTVPDETTLIPDSTTQEFTTVTESPDSTTDKPIVTPEPPICPVGVFGNVPHPEKCDAFYLCSGGIAFEMICASGFEFDPVAQVCVEIAAGGCTLGSATDNENENSNFTTTEFPTNIENITVTQEVSSTSAQDFTTEPDNDIVTDGIKETTTAELATHYPGTQESTTQKYTTDDDVDETTTLEPICPIGVFGNVAHPERCEAYFLCAGGVAFEVFCSTGFEFNPDSQECVVISEGGCTLGEVTLLPDDSVSAEAENNVTDEPTETTEDTIDVQVPICAAGVFGNVPHPERCDAFYICSAGFSFEVFCSNGFEFDPKSQECVEISKGGCTLGPVTEEENTETTTKLYSEIEETDVETETTDAPWYQPPPNSPELIPPPVGNPGVDPEEPVETVTDKDDDEVITEKNTDEDEDGDSVPDETEPICAPGVFGNIPHHSRCDAYYLCSAGMAFEVLCPSGFEFDPSTNNCAVIAEGGCTQSKNTL